MAQFFLGFFFFARQAKIERMVQEGTQTHTRTEGTQRNVGQLVSRQEEVVSAE